MDFKVVDDLLANVNIVDIISNYIPLKKNGANYKARCPFHEEKTPSFMVSESKQIFKCFGCGVGGTAVKFVQLYEKISFGQAMRKVAEMGGYVLPNSWNKEKKQDNKTDQLYRAYELSKIFFRDNLPQYGKAAEAYIKERRLSEEIVNKFELGYSLDSQRGLYSYLLKQGIKEEILKESGFFSITKNGLLDLFRDRLMIPIHSVNGRVIAFGGRKLSEEAWGGKYLNSPVTRIYVKGKELYGLNVTKYTIGKKDKVLISEGYLDMLRLYDEGFDYCVASLGTALTEQQISLLGRYTHNMYLIYDGDRAGLKASLEAAMKIIKSGFQCKIVLLPAGEDPDTYLLKEGRAGLQNLIDNAVNLVQFVKKEEDLGISLNRKVNILISTASEIPDDITRSVFLKEVSEVFGISYPAIISKYKNKLIFNNGDTSLSYLEGAEYPEERYILKVMLEEKEKRQLILEEIDSTLFLRREYREIFEVFVEQNDIDKASTFERLLTAESWAQMSEIMLMKKPGSDVKELVRDLKFRKYTEEMEKVKKEIESTGITQELMKKLTLIESRLHELQPPTTQQLLY